MSDQSSTAEILDPRTEPLLTVDEVAKWLGLNPGTLRYWRHVTAARVLSASAARFAIARATWRNGSSRAPSRAAPHDWLDDIHRRGGRALLGVSRGVGYEAALRGEIPTIRLGRRLVVPKIALERLLGITEDERPEGDTRALARLR